MHANTLSPYTHTHTPMLIWPHVHSISSNVFMGSPDEFQSGPGAFTAYSFDPFAARLQSTNGNIV